MMRKEMVIAAVWGICGIFVSLCAEPLKKDDRIVFLGDSITAGGVKPGGYVTLTSEAIKEEYPDLGIEVIGAGVSGNKVPDLQKRLDKAVLKKEPTIVVIYIGINDVWHWTHPNTVAAGRKGTTKEDFESGLRDIIAQINAVGARVILCTPTVIGEKTDGTNAEDKMLDEYSDISRKVAKETDSQLLDLRKGFMAYLKEHNVKNAEKGILTGDRVHMNEKGNRLLAELMLGALEVLSEQ
ncbi:MAG: SGNH/GDSL hydrolase family protein [Akkermansiaceae bacterium]|nr:SGNH/GDSL hydrolase family protein [Akkermansiaceae bacterium]